MWARTGRRYRQLSHLLHTLLALVCDDISGSELRSEVGAIFVMAHQDDPLGAEPSGREHRGATDGSVL